MNRRFLAVVVFALVIALGASYLVYRVLENKVLQGAPKKEVKVVVAARDLPIGTLLKEGDVKLVDWSGTPPPQAIVRLEDAVKHGVIATIYAGEPVLTVRLAATGAGGGLAATIPQGKRAVAVRVNDVVGVSGFIQPGMRVDLLISGTPPGGSNSNLGTQTRTLLQSIEVLSAGQNIQKDAEGKPISVPVVNLLVTPEQAEMLSLASNETRIQLVLRNPLDTEEAKAPGTALAYLYEGTPEGGKKEAKGNRESKSGSPRAARKPAPPRAPVMERVVIPITVEMITGTKKETIQVGQREVERPKVAAK
ncbi:MAG: Flp pilus assembly protein CpaB [Bryobacteraceae bacterium]|jgi:pilus assembly protein CpaB